MTSVILKESLLMETLILDFKAWAVPYIYQVPKPVYEKFKHYQNIKIPEIQPLLSIIDDECNAYKQNLMTSIEEWRTSTISDLERLERKDKAIKQIATLFS